MVQKTVEDRKAGLQEKKAQIEAKLKAISAREAAARRKLETRKKIVLGSLLFDIGKTTGDDQDWLLKILRAPKSLDQDKVIVAALIEEFETAKACASGQV